ncbi:MAG: GAF domain-containing protein, partial [Azoarcus sp.]
MNQTAYRQRSHVELITIYEVCRILGASLDIDRTFRETLNVLAAYLGLSRAMIVLADDEGQLRLHSAVGMSDEQIARGQWQSGEGMVGGVYAKGLPMTVPDVSNAPEFIDRTGAFTAPSGRMMALIVVPLKTERGKIGVLAAQREVEGAARLSDDQRLLTMVATLLAQAVLMHNAVSQEHERLQLEAT